MSPETWGIVAIIVVGGAVVAFGWARDRDRNRQARKELAEAPRARIPGWDGSDVRYLQETDVLAASRPAPEEPTAAERTLLQRRDEASLPSGAVDGAFLTHPRQGLAILTDPVVLVCAGEITGLTSMLNVLTIAAQQGRPFVWVAGDFDDRLLDSLRANTVTGKLQCLPIILADPGRLRAVADATGGSIVEPADVASGYLPDRVWGTCAGWIADLDDSWIVPRPRTLG